MRFTLRTLAITFLVANMALAALWLTVLHPGTPIDVSHAAQGGGAPSSLESVPLLLPPPVSACKATAVAGPHAIAPDGRPVAQLRSAPAGLSDSVSSLFTPCDVPPRSPLPASEL